MMGTHMYFWARAFGQPQVLLVKRRYFWERGYFESAGVLLGLCGYFCVCRGTFGEVRVFLVCRYFWACGSFWAFMGTFGHAHVFLGTHGYFRAHTGTFGRTRVIFGACGYF